MSHLNKQWTLRIKVSWYIHQGLVTDTGGGGESNKLTIGPVVTNYLHTDCVYFHIRNVVFDVRCRDRV